MLVALRGKGVAQVVEVVFGGLPFGDGAVFGGEVSFGIVKLGEQQARLVHVDAPGVLVAGAAGPLPAGMTGSGPAAAAVGARAGAGRAPASGRLGDPAAVA